MAPEQISNLEADSLHFLRNHFKNAQGDLFVDVGANFGWYTLPFSQFADSQDHVVALEPDEPNHQLLITTRQKITSTMSPHCSLLQAETALASYWGKRLMAKLFT